MNEYDGDTYHKCDLYWTSFQSKFNLIDEVQIAKENPL